MVFVLALFVLFCVTVGSSLGYLTVGWFGIPIGFIIGFAATVIAVITLYGMVLVKM